MRTLVQPKPVVACHWLNFGKLVDAAGAVLPGTEHALNGMSRDFPPSLRSILDVETLFEAGIEASQLLASGIEDSGAFLSFPVDVRVEPMSDDERYVVFVRLSAPSETGPGRSGRRFTQLSALVVPLDEWNPAVVLGAYRTLFASGYGAPLQKSSHASDRVCAELAQPEPSGRGEWVVLYGYDASQITVLAPDVSASVNRYCSWVAMALELPMAGRKNGDCLWPALLSVGFGLRPGVRLLGEPLAVQSTPEAEDQGRSYPVAAGEIQAVAPPAPPILVPFRNIAAPDRPCLWGKMWGHLEDERHSSLPQLVAGLKSALRSNADSAANRLMETCYPFVHVLPNQLQPLAKSSVAAVVRAMIEAENEAPDGGGYRQQDRLRAQALGVWPVASSGLGKNPSPLRPFRVSATAPALADLSDADILGLAWVCRFCLDRSPEINP